jgi:hypothetical protein
MDQWLIGVDPAIKLALDAVYDGDEAAKKGASPEQVARLQQAQDQLLEAAKKTGANNAPAPAKDDGAPFRAGYEIEVKTKEFPAVQTKYGELKISVSVKVSPSVGGSSALPGRMSAQYTSKDKSGGREGGVKAGLSYTDIKDRDLFDGAKISQMSATLEWAASGAEFTVAAAFGFTIETSHFKAPGTGKLIFCKISEDAAPKLLNLEFKIAPLSIPIKTGPITTTGQIEFKVTFAPDLKKVGAEIAFKKILLKLAKKKMEELAEKQGAKFVAEEAGEEVLADLGPVGEAFGVGLMIGDVLNTFTIAPKVAQTVDEVILGDLNERYQRASTLGKMYLISSNADRIAVALVASGVSGAVAGIGDGAVKLFKLMELDSLPGYSSALAAYLSAPEEEVPIVIDLKPEPEEITTRTSWVAHDDPPPPPPPKGSAAGKK